MPCALVIEDAPEAAELATALLRRAGFEPSCAGTGAAGIELARSLRPTLILLDLGLPDADGTDVCEAIRAFSDAYLVMLSSRDSEADKVLGLKLGADDYLTKPYSPRELLARIEALMRRPRPGGVMAGRDAVERRFGELVVQPDAHLVSVGGRTVHLTRTEFAIIDALSERPERVVTRAELLRRVWGDTWGDDYHVVDVHVANLRKKVDRGPHSFIRTVRGVGYSMAPAMVPT
jgi:DNA-binding response OmpR family regulator